jgi:hypothetical protein
MYIASFDIGKLNLCFYIEEFKEENIKNCKDTNDILKEGNIILWKNNNITQNCFHSSYIDTELFHNLTELLDNYSDYWDKCSVFLIEQQMSFGFKKINTMALKLAQHCYSYFQIKYGRNKTIIDFPAYHKTQLLSAPKKMDKPQRKIWCVNKTLEILKLRNLIMTEFNESKKKDDLADTLCMLQAYKILLSIPTTKNTITYNREELQKLKVNELKKLCKKNKYKVNGKKSDLIERLCK